MQPVPDVLIVGGGIIGLTAAYFLAETGRRAEVLDRGEPGREASWAGAGILPPGNPATATTPLDLLRSWGVSRLAEFSTKLKEITGIDPGYRRCGGVEFLTAEDHYAVKLWQAQRIQCERLGESELQQLEPAAHFPADTEAWHLPDFAQLRNPWHLRALTAACQRLGVTIRSGVEFQGWQRNGERVTAAKTSVGPREAGQYLIAAGAWAESALEPLGVQLGVRPVRGQILLYRCETAPFKRILMFGKRYLVPRADGRVLVGSTEEPDAGFVKANTTEGITELQRFAAELCPALAQAEVETAWAGLRPGSPDGLPYLGVVPGFPQVFCAVGHFRAGVQLSLGTAKLITDLLSGQPSELPTEAFRLNRPPAVSIPSAFRS